MSASGRAATLRCGAKWPGFSPQIKVREKVGRATLLSAALSVVQALQMEEERLASTFMADQELADETVDPVAGSSASERALLPRV